MRLVLRRILAVFIALLLPALAIAAIVGGTQTTDQYRELVNTGPRHIATLVEVIRPFKGPNGYVVESDGKRFTLDHGEAVDGLAPGLGDTIEYVIDSVDPWWTVGVGDPEYWEPQPFMRTTFAVVIVGSSLIFAFAAFDWILPAGFEWSGKRRARNIKGKHAADKPIS